MNIDLINKAALLTAAMALGACVSSTPPGDIADARQQLLNHHSDLHSPPEQRDAAIEDLLQQPLTPQTAAQLMLLNSPRVEMLLARMGVANARRAQAELIANPRFAIGALRPEGGGRWQLDLGLSQSLLDLLTRSLRITLAEATLAQRQLELHLALDEALNELQSAYFAAIATQQQLALYRQRQDASDAAYMLAQQMRTAGNLPPTRFLQHQFTAQTLAMETRQAQLGADTARLHLGYLLGLPPHQTVKLPDRLPDIPKEMFNPADLLALAQQYRPDMLIVRRQQDLLARHRPFVTPSRWLDISAGLKVEREFDGSVNAGPELEFGFPLFDRGRARLAEINAETAAAQAQEAHLLKKIEHDIALALRQLDDARQAYQQVTTLQKTAREQLSESQREVNFMLASPFDLLALKQQQLRLDADLVEVVQSYWQARTALALAVGKPLPFTEQEDAIPSAATPGQGHPLHHHGEHHHD